MKDPLDLLLSRLSPGALVLDIGAGGPNEVRRLMDGGAKVEICDYLLSGNRFEDVPERPLHYDAIFCSHTLEHVRNPGLFLDKIFRTLKHGGWLGIVVPPLKHEIVGGHLSLWNAGLLVYHLIRAGFDCSQASVASYDYNVAVVVCKYPALFDPTALKEDNGDIEFLAAFFPVPVHQGFDGRIQSVRWE